MRYKLLGGRYNKHATRNPHWKYMADPPTGYCWGEELSLDKKDGFRKLTESRGWTISELAGDRVQFLVSKGDELFILSRPRHTDSLSFHKTPNYELTKVDAGTSTLQVKIERIVEVYEEKKRKLMELVSATAHQNGAW